MRPHKVEFLSNYHHYTYGIRSVISFSELGIIPRKFLSEMGESLSLVLSIQMTHEAKPWAILKRRGLKILKELRQKKNFILQLSSICSFSEKALRLGTLCCCINSNNHSRYLHFAMETGSFCVTRRPRPASEFSLILFSYLFVPFGPFLIMFFCGHSIFAFLYNFLLFSILFHVYAVFH